MAVQRRPPLRAALDRVKMPNFKAVAQGPIPPGSPRRHRRAPALSDADPAGAVVRRVEAAGEPGVDPRRWLTFGIVVAAMLFVFIQLQPVAAVRRHHAGGRRHGGPRVGPRLHARPPPAQPAHHRLGPRLVRRLPRLPLLLPAAVADDRHPRLRPALRRGLQADHRLRPGHPAGGAPTPSAGWPACASRARSCWPVATLPFLFDRGFTIYGGNIPSTLAGEFSFSISLSFALLFLGRGGPRPRHRPQPGPGRGPARPHRPEPPAAHPLRGRRAPCCSTCCDRAGPA